MTPWESAQKSPSTSASLAAERLSSLREAGRELLRVTSWRNAVMERGVSPGQSWEQLALSELSRGRTDNSTCSQEHKQTALQGSIHCSRGWRAPILVSMTAPPFKGEFLDPTCTLWESHILWLYPYGQSSLWDDVDMQTAQQARLWTNRFSCCWWQVIIRASLLGTWG